MAKLADLADPRDSGRKTPDHRARNVVAGSGSELKRGVGSYMRSDKTGLNYPAGLCHAARPRGFPSGCDNAS